MLVSSEGCILHAYVNRVCNHLALTQERPGEQMGWPNIVCDSHLHEHKYIQKGLCFSNMISMCLNIVLSVGFLFWKMLEKRVLVHIKWMKDAYTHFPGKMSLCAGPRTCTFLIPYRRIAVRSDC